MINQIIEKIWQLGAEKIIVEPRKKTVASNMVLKSVGFIRCGGKSIDKLALN